jgi:quinol-cytochrome oxidoreductase complex cytochrome b subunit
MTSERLSTHSRTGVRRNAIWPWLVMPLVILALFVVLHFGVLHKVRSSGDGSLQDSSFGSGIP